MGSKQRQVGRDARDSFEIDERTRQLTGWRRESDGGCKPRGYTEGNGDGRRRAPFPPLLNFGKIY